MKKLLFLGIAALLVACSADDGTVTEQEVNLVIDHYKTTSIFYGTALIVSENNGDRFELGHVNGFEFQPGNRHTLRARKTTVKNDGTDATSSSYDLLTVQTQDTIPPNTRFSVPLATFVNGVGYVKWIIGNAETGYVLANEIPIECEQFCSEIINKLSIQEPLTGEFEHGSDGSYILKELY